jgi:hypothetical protein
MSQFSVIRSLAYCCLVLSLFSCKRGDHQTILLRNLSDESIYFILSDSSGSIDATKIEQVRPKSSIPINDNNEDFDRQGEYQRLKNSLYRYLIEKDSSEILLTSESVSIFIDAISLKEIITDRFNGELNIYIVTGHDLMTFTDQEILTLGKYIHFKSVTSVDVISDTLKLEYY